MGDTGGSLLTQSGREISESQKGTNLFSKVSFEKIMKVDVIRYMLVGGGRLIFGLFSKLLYDKRSCVFINWLCQYGRLGMFGYIDRTHENIPATI